MDVMQKSIETSSSSVTKKENGHEKTHHIIGKQYWFLGTSGMAMALGEKFFHCDGSDECNGSYTNFNNQDPLICYSVKSSLAQRREQ